MAAIEQHSRAGDTTNDLYSQYGKQIYSYCLHKLRSKEEAEDAVQTTFMNAFRSLQRGATAQFEQAWLFKIAHNVCVARATSSSRRLRLEAPNDFSVLQEVVPAREGDGELELLGIEEALELMPENQRRAILLREWQGLSYREISDELGLSQAAVEMLIFRARRALAGALEQPEEARAKHAKAGRRVGSLASLVAGALKTFLGGGAAIKAVTIAAAAVAVVGEGAQHTIVRPASAVAPAPTRAVAAALPAPHASAVLAPHASARHASVPTVAHAAASSAGVAGSRAHVAAARALVATTPAAPHVTGPHVTGHVTGPRAVAAPAVAAAPVQKNDPQPQPQPQTQSQPPAPAPAPAPTAAAAAAAPPAAVKTEQPFVAPPTPAEQPAPPADPVPAPPVDAPPTSPGNSANGNGNAFGNEKDHGKPADAGPPPDANGHGNKKP